MHVYFREGVNACSTSSECMNRSSHYSDDKQKCGTRKPPVTLLGSCAGQMSDGYCSERYFFTRVGIFLSLVA